MSVPFSEIASLTISALALAVSIYAALKSNKIGIASIQADTCKEIFYKYLIYEIPKFRSNIRFDDGKLCNGNDLCEAIASMRRSALFYKYSDPSFFDALNQKCEPLENLIVYAADHARTSNHEQDEFYKQVQSYLEDIYKMVEDKRIGKSKILPRVFTFVHKRR